MPEFKVTYSLTYYITTKTAEDAMVIADGELDTTMMDIVSSGDHPADRMFVIVEELKERRNRGK